MSSILPSHPLALADGMVSAYSLFILSLSFDETRECLTLPIHPTLALSVQQSAWHVLVSVATMILSLPPESIDDLIGKKASCISWYGQQCHCLALTLPV